MRIILLNKPLFEFMYTHGSVEYVALQLSLRIAVCIYTDFFIKLMKSAAVARIILFVSEAIADFIQSCAG
jgi:hypothetical protein